MFCTSVCQVNSSKVCHGTLPLEAPAAGDGQFGCSIHIPKRIEKYWEEVDRDKLAQAPHLRLATHAVGNLLRAAMDVPGLPRSNWHNELGCDNLWNAHVELPLQFLGLPAAGAGASAQFVVTDVCPVLAVHAPRDRLTRSYTTVRVRAPTSCADLRPPLPVLVAASQECSRPRQGYHPRGCRRRGTLLACRRGARRLARSGWG